jgi:hypothetical protein
VATSTGVCERQGALAPATLRVEHAAQPTPAVLGYWARCIVCGATACNPCAPGSASGLATTRQQARRAVTQAGLCVSQGLAA